MDEGIWMTLLGLVGLVLLFLIETAATWNVAGWLDVRASSTADEVRRNIEEYGPEVPGLHLELLPEDERRAVLEERRRLAQERADRKAAKRGTRHAAPHG